VGRLAYEFLKGPLPQPTAVLLYMRGKQRLYMRSSVVWGFFFVWTEFCVWRRGGGDVGSLAG